MLPGSLWGQAFVQIAQTSCTNCTSITFGSNLTVGGSGHEGVFILSEINASNQASAFVPTTGSNWVQVDNFCTNNGGVFSCKNVYVSCNLTAGPLNGTFTQPTPPDGFMIETFYEASGISGKISAGCVDKAQSVIHGGSSCGCTGGCPAVMFTCSNSMPASDWILSIGMGLNVPSQMTAPTLNAGWTGRLPAGAGGGVTGYLQVVGVGAGGNFRGDTVVADQLNPTTQFLQTVWTYSGNTGGWGTEMIAFGGAPVIGPEKKRIQLFP